MGWFTRQFNDAKAGKLEDWEAFHYTIYDNPLISRKEIEEIRNTVREDAWLQEYMAEDFEGGGVVYPMFQDSSVKVLDKHFPGFRSYPCVVGLDWGWNDATAAVWVHVDPQTGHLYVSQVHQKSQWEVERHAPVIERNSQGLDVKAYVLDTSAFRKEGGARLSVADKFKTNNIHVVRSEKNLDSSIDTVSGFLRGNESGPFIHIDPSCEYIIRGLQDWEMKQHEPDALAAMRYAIVKACQMKLTNLSDLMPKARPKVGTRLDPGVVYLERRKPIADQWTWDSQRGRPSLG